MKFTVSTFCEPCDFWMGVYWDKKKNALYVCPLPTWVIKFENIEGEAKKEDDKNTEDQSNQVQ